MQDVKFKYFSDVVIKIISRTKYKHTSKFLSENIFQYQCDKKYNCDNKYYKKLTDYKGSNHGLSNPFFETIFTSN